MLGYVAGDMNCDGQINQADSTAFYVALNDGCAVFEQQYPGCDCMNADLNDDGLIDQQDEAILTAILSGGTPRASDRLVYTYDAENRLTGVSPAVPQSGDARVMFTYDYLGRRVRKVSQVRYTDGTWLPWTDRVFIYDGWRVICEHGTFQGSDVHRRYTWGLDLSRSPEGAGGIGGLLAVQQGYPEPDPMMGGPEPLTMGLMSGYGQLNYIYLYDGHGNVGQLLDLTPTTWNASAVMVARYEYDPYGRVLSQLGTFANPDTNGNPFQFSTKYYDHEVGLIYFGYRYYSPRLGRWITRDPIREGGGVNVYAYLRGHVPGLVDALGLWPVHGGWDSDVPPIDGPQWNETNPVLWYLFYMENWVTRRGHFYNQSISLPNDVGQYIFMHSAAWKANLDGISSKAQDAARRLRCNSQGYAEGTLWGELQETDVAGHSGNGGFWDLGFMIGQFKYRLTYDCSLKKYCTCAYNSGVHAMTHVECAAHFRAHDLYDFHGWLDWVVGWGQPFYLDWSWYLTLSQDEVMPCRTTQP